VRNLHQLLMPNKNRQPREVPVVKTVALYGEGIDELYITILNALEHAPSSEKKLSLLTQRAYLLIQKKRMKDVNKDKLSEIIKNEMEKADFNIYRLINKW